MKKAKFYLLTINLAILMLGFLTLNAQVKIGANPTTISSNSTLETEATNGNKVHVNKDNGNLGINTVTPGSSLSVNGSMGQNYTAVTASTYTLTATDYYVQYSGTTAATFTLPVGASATCDCKGRGYEIYNNTSYVVTLNPATGETIAGYSTIALNPHNSVKIVNTNLASGSTWEFVSFGLNQPSTTLFVPYVTYAATNDTRYDIPLDGNDAAIPTFPATTTSVNDGNYTSTSSWTKSPWTGGNYYVFPSSGFYQVTATLQYGFSCTYQNTATNFAVQPMFIRLTSSNGFIEEVQFGQNISNLPSNYTVNFASNWYSATGSITRYFSAGEKIANGAQICGGCNDQSPVYNPITYNFRNASLAVIKLSN